jgi:hypothetical protein
MGGGEPSRGGTVVTVPITYSYDGVRVHHPDVPPGTGNPCARSFRQSAWLLQVLSVVSAAATQFVLSRAFTIIWTGMSLTSIVVGGDHGLNFITPRVHCHYRIDGATNLSAEVLRLSLYRPHRPTSATMSSPQLRKCHPCAGQHGSVTQSLVL